MSLTLVTWNINSVRLRMPLVAKLLRRVRPDILFLQEIKTVDDLFPGQAFRELGYEHLAVHGQKGYHGVATVSKRPFLSVESRGFCGKGDQRHHVVTIADGGGELRLHNFYVPAGGYEADPVINEKFAHKLAFLAEMRTFLTRKETARPSILVGDLNVAPLENDVWSHRQLLKVVSHTPAETEALEAIRARGRWVDAMRHFVPADQRLYTWWSYRSPNWAAADKGRRLDHIWATPHLTPRLKSIEVLKEARAWKQASDHVPVIARLASA